MPRVQGRVRWFNNEKGYGFIGAENGPDVFVHYSEIAATGFKTLQEGDLVEFEIGQGTLGPMAMRVVKLGAPETGARLQGGAGQKMRSAQESVKRCELMRLR